jgi:hypothetical protein
MPLSECLLGGSAPLAQDLAQESSCNYTHGMGNDPAG